MQVKSEIRQQYELHAWRQFLARNTLWLGIWLLGSAVICAVAANWDSVTKTQRFIGAQGLLAICVLAAAGSGWRWRAVDDARQYAPSALLALAGLLLGALLALLGQTYQTGADTWELFAVWAGLLLPWALVGRTQVVWLLWMGVVNVAGLLYTWDGHVFWLAARDGEQFLPLVLVNLLFLAGWEVAGRRAGASMRIGPRLLLAGALGLLLATQFLSAPNYYGLGSSLTWVWAVVTVGLGFYYQRVRRDLVALAILAAGVIVMSLRIVGEWWLDVANGPWVALALAAILIAEAVVAAGWLRRLAATLPAAGTPDIPAPLAAPWYVQGLLALSAWLATLLLLLFLVAVAWVESTEGALVSGLVLCGLAVTGLRVSTRLFWSQCLTAMGFGGQLLVWFALLFGDATYELHTGVWFCLLVVGALVYAFGRDVLLRFLTAGLIALALSGLIALQWLPGMANEELLWTLWDDNGLSTRVWLPVEVVGAWAAAIAFYLGYRPVWTGVGIREAGLGSFPEPQHVALPAQGRWVALRPLAWAFALAVQLTVGMVGGATITHLAALWQGEALFAVIVVAGVLLPAVCALVVLWPRRAVLTSGVVWGTPLGLLLLALFWLPSPGVAFALAWLLLGYGLRDARLTTLGVVGLLGYVMFYYYQLQVPLIDKALWLGGAALLLFCLRALVYWVPRWMKTIEVPGAVRVAPASSALRWRTVGMLAGLGLILAVVNATIWQRETLLAQGRVVILELAPVDPRSLMQGDYMALNFAVADSLRPRWDSAAHDLTDDGYVVLALNGDGLGLKVRTQEDATPLNREEVALRYRIRNGDVRMVTNAYFFSEGQADRYANARYGELRVGDDGTALLVRLLDGDRQPL
ncbi:GDYXXLXY domain-containing protein [Bordetella sp. 15P40C-2]|uniref:GDYXXLXY domain-containing protein n=1 Tax=Bordetella sp. 15P40C-2 TaxID=2572246 RepID=UPI0013279B0C|nr:GDYXXLXY domain-containing protein [Bordetella sp. 15P40C-2]MVW71314.1 DUF4401 domain-containing protein [Bordetella sp. 15P40C-2]